VSAVCTVLTLACVLYTKISISEDTILLIITLAYVDQFSKFFHWQIPKEILCICIVKIFYLRS